MKLSDLLEIVQEGAPPARYTVDDFVSAGRRRRRRRNAGWAIAAVVAVAIAIGVPQILTRPDAHPATPAPATRLLNYLFAGYQVADLQVGAPEWVGVNNQNAHISRTVPGPQREKLVGALTVYRAGFDASKDWSHDYVTATEPVGGRQAFFTVPRPTGTANLQTPDQALVWQYADGATAMVTSYDRRLSRDEMRRIASAFAVAPPRPVRQLFTTTWVPPGLRLVAVQGRETFYGGAVFVPESVSADHVTHAQGTVADMLTKLEFRDDFAGPVPTPVPPGGLVIDFGQGSGYGTGDGGKTAICRPNRQPDDIYPPQDSWATECRAMIDPGHFVGVRAGEAIPEASLRRIVASSRTYGLRDNDGSWKPAIDAFPTSAQVPRD